MPPTLGVQPRKAAQLALPVPVTLLSDPVTLPSDPVTLPSGEGLASTHRTPARRTYTWEEEFTISDQENNPPTYTPTAPFYLYNTGYNGGYQNFQSLPHVSPVHMQQLQMNPMPVLGFTSNAATLQQPTTTLQETQPTVLQETQLNATPAPQQPIVTSKISKRGKKASEDKDQSSIRWEKDSSNEEIPRTSQDVLLEFICQGDWYNRYRGDTVDGKTKMGMVTEISDQMKKIGLNRAPNTIQSKIAEFVKKYNEVVKWLSETGQGIIDEANEKAVDELSEFEDETEDDGTRIKSKPCQKNAAASIKEYIRKKCPYFYDVQPVFGDRACNKPLHVMSSIKSSDPEKALRYYKKILGLAEDSDDSESENDADISTTKPTLSIAAVLADKSANKTSDDKADDKKAEHVPRTEKLKRRRESNSKEIVAEEKEADAHFQLQKDALVRFSDRQKERLEAEKEQHRVDMDFKQKQLQIQEDFKQKQLQIQENQNYDQLNLEKKRYELEMETKRKEMEILEKKFKLEQFNNANASRIEHMKALHAIGYSKEEIKEELKLYDERQKSLIGSD